MTKPRNGDRCLLCGSPPEIIGIFVPENPSMWGAAPGKTRFIRYCLCSRCSLDAATPEAVEKVAMHEIVMKGAAYAAEE